MEITRSRGFRGKARRPEGEGPTRGEAEGQARRPERGTGVPGREHRVMFVSAEVTREPFPPREPFPNTCRPAWLLLSASAFMSLDKLASLRAVSRVGADSRSPSLTLRTRLLVLVDGVWASGSAGSSRAPIVGGRRRGPRDPNRDGGCVCRMGPRRARS